MDDVVEFPRARTKPLSEADALDALRRAGRIEGIGTFAELVGWWRRRVVGRRAHPAAHPAHPPARRSLARILAAAVLFLAALDLAGSGLVMNARYAASLGSGEGATIQAAIGIAIDAIALVLLSAGYLLLSNGHRRLAVLAWIVWPVMLGLSLMNTIGFSATNISDALAKRSTAVTKASTTATRASTTASDIKRWREERDTIIEKRSVEEIKLQLSGPAVLVGTGYSRR
jgi:hypothetical protein